MNTLEKIEALLPALTKVEKAKLLQWVVSELAEIYPGIEITKDICDGKARILRTRIPVWSLVNSKKLGFSDLELLHEYPSITQEDLDNAWNYYRSHKEEIDALIFENETV